MKTFQAHNLKVGYSEKIVVDNVEFKLKKGEILCLLGPNGSGKSTIIKTIIDNLDIIYGKLTYLGRDMRRFSQNERAKNMSIVLTERINPEMMTALEVVSTGRYPYTNHFGKLDEEDLLIIEEAIGIVNGGELKDKEFSRLSDGERQRIMIARAICQESDIMVLDEPTSFLDIRYKVELLNILKLLAKEKEKIIIMSLHEIDLVSKIADKVLLIDGGRVFKYGTPEEVITDENIKIAYQLEEGVFNTSLGTMELSKIKGNDYKVFVIGGGGKGIPVYRALNRGNIPFRAGVLFENDMDYHIARALGMDTIVGPAFSDISSINIEKGKKTIDSSEIIIDTGVELVGINERNRELIDYAYRKNKMIYSLRKEDLGLPNIIKKESITSIIKDINNKTRTD